MEKEVISDSVIRRLPRYYRYLSELEYRGIERTSSAVLSEKLGLTASQIRQDLNCFGGFGHQGYGYNVAGLKKQLAKILGLDKCNPLIIVGAGHLGGAIAEGISFSSYGFYLVGIFDISPEICGTVLGGLTVQSMSGLPEFCNTIKPKTAVLCIPKESAQAVAEQLVDLGICGFWNFSHCDLDVDRSVIQVENVHLGDSLMTLSYKLHKDE
ncbi:MAG: redox-sensing transcriptional repressor Rex [Ruminococcus sp.]|nr:redox-sensing transcriptional repressor Rex [Ruminococcus sp.]